MTQHLSNENFATHMRRRRGAAPKTLSPPKVFELVAVWRPGHKEPPGRILTGVDSNHVLMAPCIPTGIPRTGFDPYLAHKSEYTCAHLETSDDGPDIWRVTFKPGRTPKGW